MRIHSVSYYEAPDCEEMFDITYQCSFFCMDQELAGAGIHVTKETPYAGQANMKFGSVSWGGHPCGDETDYDVYCSQCGELLWHGLESVAK